MATLLPENEVAARLARLPTWSRDGARIARHYEAEDVPSAVALVVRIAFAAEALGHHPDLTWTYTRLGVSLTTHDAGGLTELDFALADRVEALFAGGAA